ncbi:hypothetical protein Fot_15042 [Forsythia ovata]|uniref:Uncharacterized protein n=1 Tax=Forsythia ovata TaxID=205694 RepID=A0ABD1W844_9LAMI
MTVEDDTNVEYEDDETSSEINEDVIDDMRINRIMIVNQIEMLFRHSPELYRQIFKSKNYFEVESSQPRLPLRCASSLSVAANPRLAAIRPLEIVPPETWLGPGLEIIAQLIVEKWSKNK